MHSIIYKLSDVKMNINNRNDIDSPQNEHEPHCASEKLHRKLQKENNLLKESNSKSRLTNENKVNEKSDINLNKLNLNGGVISSDNHKDKLNVIKRFKRWLPDEEVNKQLLTWNLFWHSAYYCAHKFPWKPFWTRNKAIIIIPRINLD